MDLSKLLLQHARCMMLHFTEKMDDAIPNSTILLPVLHYCFSSPQILISVLLIVLNNLYFLCRIITVNNYCNYIVDRVRRKRHHTWTTDYSN